MFKTQRNFLKNCTRLAQGKLLCPNGTDHCNHPNYHHEQVTEFYNFKNSDRNYGMLNGSEKIPISLYFHWPFCLSICSYCDFNRYKRNSVMIESLDENSLGKQMMDTYLNVMTEIKRKIQMDLSVDGDLSRYELVSVFFGGGTPSTMNPKMMERIISHGLDIFGKSREDGVEISMEANPTSIEYEKLRDFHRAGINRVSIGVQSFDLECLKSLGREHSIEDALKAIDIAKNTFGEDRISIDLMFGLAQHKQNPSIWKKSLEQALSLNMSHLSLYQLTIEKGTKFHRLFNVEKDLPNEEESSHLYEYTIEQCKNHGLEMYEVSNFAKPGKECKHNIMYWKSIHDFIGIGPGAHGRLTNHNTKERFSTVQVMRPEDWIERVANQLDQTQPPSLLFGDIKEDKLTEEQQIEELFMMGLRMPKEGVRESSLRFINSELSFDKIISANMIKQLESHGYINLIKEENDRRIVATTSGISVLDILIANLLAK